MNNEKQSSENEHMLHENDKINNSLRTMNFKLDLREIKIILSIAGCTDTMSKMPTKISTVLKDGLFELTKLTKVLFIMGLLFIRNFCCCYI